MHTDLKLLGPREIPVLRPLLTAHRSACTLAYAQGGSWSHMALGSQSAFLGPYTLRTDLERPGFLGQYLKGKEALEWDKRFSGTVPGDEELEKLGLFSLESRRLLEDLLAAVKVTKGFDGASSEKLVHRRIFRASVMLRGLILFTLLAQVTAGRWGKLCAGNLRNRVRGTDIYGNGAYGAPRKGGTTHKGVDVVCRNGSTVYAPFSGRLMRRATPYRETNAINNGVKLEGAGYCVKIFYIAPERYTGYVLKGQKIGTLLNVQSVYPGITSHVHIEMCNTSTDPTSHL
uniref:leukocyte cell-derived chemotaxin-2-like n=1 Tax=Pristiophorus japonicus TaxID=55135 RepID=UPI00398F475E